jgi:Domain of unknown function (DUF4136)
MRYAILVVATVGLLLPACTFVRSDVTRFDQLPSDTTGATVFFLPLEDQKMSAAYLSYADRVAAQLARYGMRKTDDIEQADYAILINYGVGGERQISGAMPLYGQTGGGTTSHSGSISTFGAGGSAFGTYNGTVSSASTYGIVGMMPYSRTEHDRYFIMHMIDIKNSTAENIVPVYEGTVVSTGSNRSFEQVADCMLLALFQNFRQSGSDRLTFNKASCE